MELSLLILVCIHKSCIVYFEISVVPIGRGFSFFLVTEKSWKIYVGKDGASCVKSPGKYLGISQRLEWLTCKSGFVWNVQVTKQALCKADCGAVYVAWHYVGQPSFDTDVGQLRQLPCQSIQRRLFTAVSVRGPSQHQLFHILSGHLATGQQLDLLPDKFHRLFCVVSSEVGGVGSKVGESRASVNSSRRL